MNPIKRLKERFERETPTMKLFIVLIVLLIIGIIIRWDYVVDGITAGFGFFRTK